MRQKIQDIAEVMIGHTYRGSVKHQSDGDTPLVQSKDINPDGTVAFEGLPRVALGETRSKAYLEKGDILLSSRGTFRAGVWEGGLDHALATATVYVIRLKDAKVDPNYLALFLNSDAGQKEIYQCVRGATIPALSKNEFMKEVLVPILSAEDQKIAVEVYKLAQTLAKLQIKKQELTKNISDAAISKLLTC